MTVGVWDITRWDTSTWSSESVVYQGYLEDYTALTQAVVGLLRDDDVDELLEWHNIKVPSCCDACIVKHDIQPAVSSL